MQVSLHSLNSPPFIVAHTNEVFASGIVQTLMLLSPMSEMQIVGNHHALRAAIERTRAHGAITLMDMSFGNATRPSVRYLSLLVRNDAYCVVAMAQGLTERLCAQAGLVGVHSFLDLDWPAEAIKGALAMIKNGVFAAPILTPANTRFPFDREDWLLVDGIRQALTNREIGEKLGLSEGGVKQKVNALLAKTKCENRNELRAFADDYLYFETQHTVEERTLAVVPAVRRHQR